MDVRGKPVLVLGMGDSGLSMARHLARHGARVRVADTREAPPRKADLLASVPDAELFCGDFPRPAFLGTGLIAISPGVPRAQPLVAEAAGRAVPVIGDMELFAMALREAQATGRAPADTRVLATTGTNGKTTVTSMVGAMCRKAGLATEVAGNIGPAVLEAWERCEANGRFPRAWSLELSSFQLESTWSLAPTAAAVLNVSEDHLDRYPDIEAYAAAKARIFEGAGTQVLNRDDPRVMAMARTGAERRFFGRGAPTSETDLGLVQSGGEIWLAEGRRRLLKVSELCVSGLHNALNALAALALCRAAGIPPDPLVESLREFKGLAHRVEKVAEVAGVAFYDDSKGTNVGATVAAVEGLGRKVVLIAGGDGKGQDFSPLAPVAARSARAVVLIGRDAPRIASALAEGGVAALRAEALEKAVEMAFALAQPGDAVLLSPACASFDMFRDYTHRAEVFIAAVRRLAEARP